MDKDTTGVPEIAIRLLGSVSSVEVMEWEFPYAEN
jgi:hypothetical protein